nr:CRISPR-associated endoribonuclease Cas6 [Thermanaeromonas toyohensis]
MHEQGFELGKRKFKLFTFSRLMGKVRVAPRQGYMLFSPPINVVICSPLAIILQEVASGLLKQGYIRLGKELLQVDKVTATDQVVQGRNIVVRMLSPLTVYSTLVDSEYRYTHYYSPFEPRFQELILANLTKKYWLIFGRQAEQEGFSIEPLSVSEKDFKIVKYKGTIIKGWMGIYRLQGDPQLLEVALDAGLGGKNSQGFGCCELVGVEGG